MASNSIELDIGGKYSAAAMFKQFDKDVKDAGRSMKDMGGAATNVANSIAGAFDTKLNGALKSSLGLFQEMARGGIWGAMSAVTTTVISALVDRWNQAKEAARQYADICRNNIVETMKGLGERFTSLGKDIQSATADAKELLAVTNGEVAQKAELKIHQLNIQTLQKITDDMSTATRDAMLATSALEAAEIRQAAAIEQAENATKTASQQQTLASQKRTAAEERLANAQTERANFEEVARKHGSGWLVKYEELQAKASMSTEELMANGLALEQALQYRKSASLALAQFEEEHKNEVQSLNEVVKLEKAARTDVDVAKREETSASRALTIAQQNEEKARWASAEQVEQARQKMYDANATLDKETQTKQQELLQAEKKAEQERVLDQLRAEAIEKNRDYSEYMDLATKAMKEGMLAETAINLVRKRYEAAMKEAAAQKEKEAKEAKEGKTSGGKDLEKTIEKGASKAVASTSVNVSAGGVGDGVDQSKQIIKTSDLQREAREDQRKMRDHMDAVNQSSAAMQDYLKGKMSPEVAAKFEEKMVKNGWTSKDIEQCTKKALNSQLLTHSQMVNQQQAILDMDKKLKALGLK